MVFKKLPNSLNSNALIYKLHMIPIVLHRAVKRLNKKTHVKDLAKCLAIALY